MRAHDVHYEVIGVAFVEGMGGHSEKYVKLLYRGDGTPWWCASAGMEMRVPLEFDVKPGDKIKIGVTVV